MKQTFILSIICLCMLSCGDKKNSSEEGSDEGSDELTEVVITPEFTANIRQYDRLGTFHEGLAKARRDGYYGFINTLGEEVIPCRYTEVGDFSNGMVVISNGLDKYGYINRKGEAIIPCKYERAGDFSEGIACVSTGNYINDFEAYLDFIDTEGNVIEALSGKYTWPIFCDCYGNPTSLPQFENGVCQVLNPTDDEFDWPDILIDTKGQPCEQPESTHETKEEPDIIAFADGTKDPVGHATWGLKDKAGNVVLPCVFSYIENFSEGVAVAYVETGGNIGRDGMEDEDYIAVYGYVDPQGNHTFTKEDFEKVGMTPPPGLQ